MQKRSGQVVVEYTLLVVVGVMIATLLINMIIGSSDTNPGFLVGKWRRMIQVIGADQTDSPN